MLMGFVSVQQKNAWDFYLKKWLLISIQLNSIGYVCFRKS
jgi:hypothetical protein